MRIRYVDVIRLLLVLNTLFTIFETAKIEEGSTSAFCGYEHLHANFNVFYSSRFACYGLADLTWAL